TYTRVLDNASSLHVLATDDQKARGIVRAVFDLLGQLAQPIQLSRHVNGDGRRIPLALHSLGGVGVARYRHALDVGVVRVQPLAALGQRLGVGINAGDAIGLGRLAHQQVMVDAQLDFAADDDVVLEEAVQRVVDRAFGGV